MADEKIVSLSERRKQNMPQACTQMADVTEMLKSLLSVMEAQGKDCLCGYVNGWNVKIDRDQTIRE